MKHHVDQRSFSQWFQLPFAEIDRIAKDRLAFVKLPAHRDKLRPLSRELPRDSWCPTTVTNIAAFGFGASGDGSQLGNRGFAIMSNHRGAVIEVASRHV